MPVQFSYRGVTYTTDTPQEADEMLALLKKREAEAAIEGMRSRFFGHMQEAQQLFSPLVVPFPWTRDMFISLMARIGEPQKALLAHLVTAARVSDEELRNILDLSGNQALAGTLSGISKQAASLNIPARAIFSFENSRVGGKRRSEYVVALEFRKIASELNWPPTAENTSRNT
jgi:hypothetical protein